MVFELFLLITWVILLLLGSIIILFRFILPKYKITVAEVSFQELLLALNATIQTEIELWEKDVFVNKHSITNSNFENYYLDITEHIIKSLSPTFFISIGKYLTEDAVVSMIGRRVKEYLVSKVNGTI